MNYKLNECNLDVLRKISKKTGFITGVSLYNTPKSSLLELLIAKYGEEIDVDIEPSYEKVPTATSFEKRQQIISADWGPIGESKSDNAMYDEHEFEAESKSVTMTLHDGIGARKEKSSNNEPKKEEKYTSDDLARHIARAIAGLIPKQEVDNDSIRKIYEKIEQVEMTAVEIAKKAISENGYKKLEVKTPKSIVRIDEHTHQAFEKVLKIIGAGVPVMLTGESGSGKTHGARQIAKALGLKFKATSCSADMQLSKLVGYMDAEGKYVEGDLFRVYTEGGLYCLDEMDASPAEVLVALNSAIENRYLNFPCGDFDAHEDFRVIACCNTWGNGATSFYTARSAIDKASLRRYAKIYWTYDESLESKILTKDTAETLKKLRNKVNDIGARLIVSTGQGIRIDQLLEVGFEKKEAYDMMILEGNDSSTQDTLRRSIW